MTDERCKQILYDLRFVVEKEYYSEEVEEALDRAIEAVNECEIMKKKLHISTQSILDSVSTRVIPAELQEIRAEAMRNKFKEFKEMFNGGAEDGEDSSVD